MADLSTPIPFTVGDQERLVNIERRLEGLCKDFDPSLVKRVESLEGSRKKWYTAIVSLGSGATLTAFGIWLKRLVNGG